MFSKVNNVEYRTRPFVNFCRSKVMALSLQVSIVNANRINRLYYDAIWKPHATNETVGWSIMSASKLVATNSCYQRYINVPSLCCSCMCFRNPLWVRNGTHKSSERLLSQLTMRRGRLSWSVIDPKCHSQHVALYCAWTMCCWCSTRVTLSAKYVLF